MTKDWKKSLTFKGDGSFAHPWLVIKGDTVEDLQDQLSEAHEKDLFTAIGRAHAAMQRGALMGAELNATTVKAEATPQAEAPAPSAKPAPESTEPAESSEAAEAPAVPTGAPAPAWLRGK